MKISLIFGYLILAVPLFAASSLFFLPRSPNGEMVEVENNKETSVSIPLNPDQEIILPAGANVILLRHEGKWLIMESNYD
jgi:hypothetical protein